MAALIDYTNHRGERASRKIEPLAIYYDDNNKWHGEAWILLAMDLNKAERREFALREILGWTDL